MQPFLTVGDAEVSSAYPTTVLTIFSEEQFGQFLIDSNL
jgi:hypothetical protein